MDKAAKPVHFGSALLLAFAAAAPCAAQEAPSAADPLVPLHVLVGSWEGAIDGTLGRGTGVREYELILGGRFVMYRQASVRRPQPASPEGDHHRELSVFSYDTERETIVLREFFVEGVVSRSVCTVERPDPLHITCATEEVENGPGLSATLTIRVADPFTFDEIFELRGMPSGPIVFTNRWTRAPKLR